MSKKWADLPSTVPLYWVKKPQPLAELVMDGYVTLNSAVIWGNDGWDVGEENMRRLRRRLPRPIDQWLCVLVDWEYRRDAKPALRDPPLFTRLGRADALDRDEWLKLIRKACSDHGIEYGRVESALREPATTARLAYRLAKLAAARLGLASQELGLALAVLRIAALPLLGRQQCDLCFRVAFPRQTRCRFHSRSKGVVSAVAIQASRTARSILRGPGFIQELLKEHRRVLSRDKLLAGVLFKLPAACSEDWYGAVMDELRRSPLVRAMLSPDFASQTPQALLAELRSAIDPDEWNAGIWPETIALADEWLSFAKLVAPGAPPKGPRPATHERICKARELLKAGYNMVETADSLGIRVANLYQILHRYGNVHALNENE